MNLISRFAVLADTKIARSNECASVPSIGIGSSGKSSYRNWRLKSGSTAFVLVQNILPILKTKSPLVNNSGCSSVDNLR